MVRSRYCSHQMWCGVGIVRTTPRVPKVQRRESRRRSICQFSNYRNFVNACTPTIIDNPASTRVLLSRLFGENRQSNGHILWFCLSSWFSLTRALLSPAFSLLLRRYHVDCWPMLIHINSARSWGVWPLARRGWWALGAGGVGRRYFRSGTFIALTFLDSPPSWRAPAGIKCKNYPKHFIWAGWARSTRATLTSSSLCRQDWL